MATGISTIDFGPFPGASDATKLVTGLTGIQADSLVQAEIHPIASADHSADEHMVETIKIVADPSTIVAGTSVVVRAFNTSELNEPLDAGPPVNPLRQVAGSGSTDPQPYRGGRGTRLYGVWNFFWVWK